MQYYFEINMHDLGQKKKSLLILKPHHICSKKGLAYTIFPMSNIFRKHENIFQTTKLHDNWVFSFIWKLFFIKLRSRPQMYDILANLQRKSAY